MDETTQRVVLIYEGPHELWEGYGHYTLIDTLTGRHITQKGQILGTPAAAERARAHLERLVKQQDATQEAKATSVAFRRLVRDVDGDQ